MTLPPPEICHRILALHVLLGFPDDKDERRIELLKLLAEHGLTWNSLPEFFAEMKVTTSTPLPAVGSTGWRKRCIKICHLHAAMGSSDKDGLAAHKKLVQWLTKRFIADIEAHPNRSSCASKTCSAPHASHV
jgi:hypothetical protein